MRTNLAFMDVDGKVKTIMVTSSLQGEGKSVTVANLAVTLALAGKKVVVVDADLRRPRQHRLFGLHNETGAQHRRRRRARSLRRPRCSPVDVVPGDGDGTPGRLRRPGSPRSRRRHQALGADQRPHPAEPRRDRRLAALRADARQSCATRRTSCSSTRRPCWPSATPRRWPRGRRPRLPRRHGEGAPPGAAGRRRPAVPAAVRDDGRRRPPAGRAARDRVLLRPLPVHGGRRESSGLVAPNRASSGRGSPATETTRAEQGCTRDVSSVPRRGVSGYSVSVDQA